MNIPFIEIRFSKKHMMLSIIIIKTYTNDYVIKDKVNEEFSKPNGFLY